MKFNTDNNLTSNFVYLTGWSRIEHYAAEAGFTVYDSIHGFILGIDGAGYSFYESHWAPLYRAATGNLLPDDKIPCDCQGKAKKCFNCGGMGYTVHKTHDQKQELQRLAALELVKELTPDYFTILPGMKKKAQEILGMTE